MLLCLGILLFAVTMDGISYGSGTGNCSLLIYLLVFALTSRSYYKIVGNQV